MKMPIHTRFQNSTLFSFKKFYKANDSKFTSKTVSINRGKESFECLQTCDGYVVYRTQTKDGQWGSVRTATPAEVYNNESILKSSQALKEELKSTPDDDKKIKLKPNRRVTPIATKHVPSIAPEAHSSTLVPEIYTQDEQETAKTLVTPDANDYSPEAEQAFVKGCNALVHEIKSDNSAGAEQRARLMVYGALISSGRGMTWPLKENPDTGSEDTSFDFDLLLVNFSRLHPDGPDGTEDSQEVIINSRMEAARAALKAHDVYMRSPTISSEQIQKNKAREEVDRIARFIRARLQKEHAKHSLSDIANCLNTIEPSITPPIILKLLNTKFMDSAILPTSVIKNISALSRALAEESKQETEEEKEHKGAKLRKESPTYHPKYNLRQLMNPGLATRGGTNLFAKLHDHAGLPAVARVLDPTTMDSFTEVQDTPFNYDDVEAFRHYYLSKFPEHLTSNEKESPQSIAWRKSLRKPPKPL